MRRGKSNLSFPILLQELVDFSEGIPGLKQAGGAHDLRIALMNGQIVYSYFRPPAPGKLLASLSQGGSQTSLNTQELPKSTKNMALAID